MAAPSTLIVVQLSVNTSGTANTDVVSTVIAAPGAGLHFRIWAASLSGLPNNTGKLAIELRTASMLLRLASQVGADDYQSIPGGIRGTSNTALTGSYRSDVATQVLRCQVYYTLESD